MSNFNDPNALRTVYGDPERTKVDFRASKWMNAGEKVVADTDNVTVPELLKAAGLDFKVRSVPMAGLVTLPDASIQPLEVPCVFGALKEKADGSSEMISGVAVGKKYRNVQNDRAFAIVEAMRIAGFLKPQAAGQLRVGALSWLFSTLGEREVRRQDGTVDIIENHLYSMNSFDGSTRVLHGISPRNLGCDNALMATVAGIKTKFSFSHTVSAEEAVELANQALPEMIHSIDELTALFQRLADAKMGVRQFKTFAQEWLDETYGKVAETGTDEKSIADRAARQSEEDALIKDFKEGIGNSGVSAWDGFQSITEFLDHHTDRYRKAARTTKHLQNDLSSNLFGQAGKAKSRALAMLVKGR